MTKSELTIKNVSWDDLGVIPNVFRKLGITIERKGDDIFIPCGDAMNFFGIIGDIKAVGAD